MEFMWWFQYAMSNKPAPFPIFVEVAVLKMQVSIILAPEISKIDVMASIHIFKINLSITT